LVAGAGTTAFSRPVAVVFLVLVVFRSGRRRGRERPAAAVAAVLALLGSSAVPFAVPCLVVAYGGLTSRADRLASRLGLVAGRPLIGRL
jgi:hypothetical protein